MSDTMRQPQILSPWPAVNDYIDYLYFNDTQGAEECQKLDDCLHSLRGRLCKSQALMLLTAYRKTMLRTAVAKDAECIVIEECARYHKRQSRALTMPTSLRTRHMELATVLKVSAESLRKEVNQLTFRAYKAQDIMQLFI